MLKIVYYYIIKRIYTIYIRSHAIFDHMVRQCHSLRLLVTDVFSPHLRRSFQVYTASFKSETHFPGRARRSIELRARRETVALDRGL